MLLKHLVGGDDQHRSGGFETYAALDAYDRVADMHVASDGVAGSEALHFAYGFDLVGERLAVDGRDLALLE